MKAEELRLGDCVLYKGTPCFIRGVGVTGDTVIDYGLPKVPWVTVRVFALDPIKLTDEMLLQNGWVLTESSQYGGFAFFRHKGVIPVLVAHKDHGDYSSTVFRIRYVHTFQQHLWLLGYEDLANDFKIK